jgi:hypothetical protein
VICCRNILQDRRVRFVKDHSSVLVRLLDGQRRGQLAAHATAVPPSSRIIPTYAAPIAAAMNKAASSKAYRTAVPANSTPEGFVADLNATAIALAGLEHGGGGASANDYGEGSER